MFAWDSYATRMGITPLASMSPLTTHPESMNDNSTELEIDSMMNIGLYYFKIETKKVIQHFLKLQPN